MDESNEWLTRFEQIHNDINNTAVYWMAVFMVVVGTTGLLWPSEMCCPSSEAGRFHGIQAAPAGATADQSY